MSLAREPGLSAAEAAEIIGVSRQSVYRLVHLGRLPKQVKGQWSGLDRETVEREGLGSPRGGHPYFLTAPEAALLLGVTPKRVHQLVAKGLPAGGRARGPATVSGDHR